VNTEAIYARLPVPLQELACTWAGWKRYRARVTPHFERTLSAIETLDGASLEALYAYQLRQLATLANRARLHVPHYRAMNLPAFDASAEDPAKGIREILDAFPVLEKQAYREAPESFLAEDVPAERRVKGKTSGTTGSALPLWYTSESLAEEYAVVWRMRRRQGVQLRDPHFTFGGQMIAPLAQSKPPFWRTNHYSHQTLFSLYHMTEEFLPAYVDAMHTLPVTYVEGYPSSLHLLARAMLEAGRPLKAGRVKAVFPSSESLLAFHRQDIEEAFASRIYDRYGTSEFAVSMTGCDAGNLHVDMEFGAVEVEASEETDDWVRGALLVTGFANDATPFIRYRIGDVGTRSKHPCPCGRPGEVFLDVDGRIEDYVVTPDGRWVGRMDHVFKEQLEIAEAQILQEDSGSIEVLLVPRGGFNASAEADVLREIRMRLGEEIRVDLKRVERIPREPNGKFRAVKSRVGRQPTQSGVETDGGEG
jgi:phenylacetate-CoA ligase